MQNHTKDPVNLGTWVSDQQCTDEVKWGCGHAGTDNTWPGANGRHRYWCWADDGGSAGYDYMTCSPTCTNGTVTPDNEIQQNTDQHWWHFK